MATVELSGLTKTYGNYTALKGLNLSIADGEFIVLLGPSGCGKSTTMRLVAGLEEITSGEILIDGERVNERPARDRNLAMVFQNYALYPHMTVGENIGYPLKIAGIRKDERQKAVDAAAAKVEMGHLLSRRPSELSGGQRQRVALARAIVRTPRLFLMDEPLSNLDAKLRTVMRAELKHLQNELATTTIYVTHDQVEAMTLADRIVILNDAVIQQVGTPAEIYARPANTFVASFIGSPPMNLISGTLADGILTHAAGQLPMAGAGEVKLGVRPEDIHLCEGDDPVHFEGQVYSAELLGDCVLLNIKTDEGLLSARVPPTVQLTMGDTVKLRFDTNSLHLYDATTGNRRDS